MKTRFCLAMAVLPAIVCLLSNRTLAADAKPPAAMLAAAYTSISGAADQSEAKLAAALAPDATIVDEFAPYEWKGAGSVHRYAVALRAWVATGGLKDLRVFTEEPRFWNVQGPRAWISIPATFTFVMDGKSDSESGVYAIVLTQSGAAWKVRSFSWATTAFALGR